MKLAEFIQVKGVIASLVRIRLPTKTSYKLWKLIKAVETEEEFFNSKLVDLLKEYGKPDEKGNYDVPKEKETDFKKAVDELGNVEVTPPEIKFTVDELQNLSLSVLDLAVIEKFIKEETNG